MTIQSWLDSVAGSLTVLWDKVIGFIPELIGAFLVIVIGWIVAAGIGRLVMHILNAIRINQVFIRVGFDRALSRAGLRLDVGKFVGKIVEWFLIIVFLLAAADILGLPQVGDFLIDVLSYLPNVVIAVFILLFGVIAANFLRGLVRHSVKALGLFSARFLGGVTWWAVVIFAVLAALIELKIATELILTIFTGVVAGGALAFGLAFGLGGKEAARAFLEDLIQRRQ